MNRGLLFAMAALLGGSASAQSPAGVSGMKEADHLRNVRYCEIFVVKRHRLSATAAVYNTVGLNDCPEQQWHSLDVDTLKKQTGAFRVIFNGPRYFIMDRSALRNPGPEYDFGGLKTHLVAEFEVKQGSEKRSPYVTNTIERQTCYVYEAGKNAYNLYSPNGNSYIMQSYSVEVDPHLNEAALASLNSRLSLPRGWRYECRVLVTDLTICNRGGQAQVVQDDFKNTYQRVDP